MSDVDDSASIEDVGLAHVVHELRMIRTEMEGYYSMLFKAQTMMLESWGDFFSLWMAAVKSERLGGSDVE